MYGTVKNHKGAISVDSEEGRGTSFVVHLPVSTKPTEPRSGEHDLDPGELRADAHVLLVDDEDMVCDTASEMLRSMGYRVSIRQNGSDAVELFEQMGEEIDLVILDMIMPVMGGGDTFDALRRVSPDVRVLLSSGYSLDGQAQSILDRGA